MKNLNVIKTLFAFSLLSSVLIIGSCKKEEVRPGTDTVGPVTISATPQVDSANYFKGYLGTEPVKFEGNAIAYNAYVDPDSVQNHGGNGQQGQDNDAYFMNGSKWVAISGAGLQTTNASIELRSLAVRVFVSPLQSESSIFYNLIKPTAYPFSTSNDPSKGAYISLYDKNGVLWTSAGDQDGSTLTVSTIGPNMSSYAVVTGLISCKMYDPHGNMKQLTGATFTASMGI